MVTTIPLPLQFIQMDDHNQPNRHNTTWLDLLSVVVQNILPTNTTGQIKKKCLINNNNNVDI